MVKRLGWTMVLVATAWVGAGGFAEASCAESAILLAVPGTVIGDAVPVAWVIEPACPVIETGLLLGPSPTALTPVGQPIYGVRTPYRLELPLPESGSYWIAAWARDEEGTRLQAEAQQVLVMMPPPVPGGPTGSHAPGSQDPASYTGTDADFLRPAASAADPRHFASLRSAAFERQQRNEFRDSGFPQIFTNAATLRVVGSTHPDEVRAAQREPFTLLGEPAPVPLEPVSPGSPDIEAALARVDAGFQASRFPRPGFYSILCDVFRSGVGGVEIRSCSLFGPPTAVGLTYEAFARETVTSLSPTRSLTTSQRFAQSSRVTYFLPAAPPGQRVARATLRVFVQAAGGDLTQIRLSGKPPATTEVVRCVQTAFGVNFCAFWLTWDFTAEAQAAAAQGGGLLELTPDPIPPATFTSPTLSFSNATYSLGTHVDYPWLHGFSPDNRLVVTFTEPCPQELNLSVTPETILPVIPPGNTIPPAIRNLQTKATVTATVKTCPPPGGSPPASVEVMLRVEPPAPAGADDGGHVHGARPLTAFGRLDPSLPSKPKEATCLVTTFNADGMGSCSVTYHASEVSGKETIVASATGFPNATTKVTVRVLGLVNLADVQTNFWRLVGRTATHPDNHWGTPDTVTNIQLVALDVFEVLGASLRINDISLPMGGLFDICGTWNPADTCPPLTSVEKGGHFWHRTGTGVDIGRTACRGLLPEGTSVLTDCPGTDRVSVARDFIESRCSKRNRATMVREANYHCEWPQ